MTAQQLATEVGATVYQLARAIGGTAYVLLPDDVLSPDTVDEMKIFFAACRAAVDN